MIRVASSPVGGEVNMAAMALDIGDTLIEVVVQMIQRMLLDLARQLAQPIRIRQKLKDLLAARVLPQHRVVHRSLEPLIPRRLHADRMKIKLRGVRLLQKFLRIRINRTILQRIWPCADCSSRRRFHHTRGWVRRGDAQ